VKNWYPLHNLKFANWKPWPIGKKCVLLYDDLPIQKNTQKKKKTIKHVDFPGFSMANREIPKQMALGRPPTKT